MMSILRLVPVLLAVSSFAAEIPKEPFSVWAGDGNVEMRGPDRKIKKVVIDVGQSTVKFVRGGPGVSIVSHPIASGVSQMGSALCCPTESRACRGCTEWLNSFASSPRTTGETVAPAARALVKRYRPASGGCAAALSGSKSKEIGLASLGNTGRTTANGSRLIL